MCVILGCVSAPVVLHYANLRPQPRQSYASATTLSAAPSVAEEYVRPSVPTRLKIPKINVNVAIGQVGLTPQGDLDAPERISSTGWYKDGIRPGEIGSAVIDGHYGWVRGEPAVFNNLHKLQKGDELYVEGEDGIRITFIVRGSRLYAPGENATAVFHSDENKARLNLITCQGAWDNGQQSYTTRLVVFTEKE